MRTDGDGSTQNVEECSPLAHPCFSLVWRTHTATQPHRHTVAASYDYTVILNTTTAHTAASILTV